MQLGDKFEIRKVRYGTSTQSLPSSSSLSSSSAAAGAASLSLLFLRKINFNKQFMKQTIQEDATVHH